MPDADVCPGCARTALLHLRDRRASAWRSGQIAEAERLDALISRLLRVSWPRAGGCDDPVTLGELIAVDGSREPA